MCLRMKEGQLYVSHVALCYAQAKFMLCFQLRVEVWVLQKQNCKSSEVVWNFIMKFVLLKDLKLHSLWTVLIEFHSILVCLHILHPSSSVYNNYCTFLLYFLPSGAKINIAACCDTLTRFRQAIQNKRSGMSHSVCLLNDNVWPHSAHFTTPLVEIQVGYTGPSADMSTPCAQRFPLVSSPKETSLWDKVRWRWGGTRSHDMVQRVGCRLLWLGDTEAGSKT